MDIKIFPRSQEYRDHFDDIFKISTDDYFKASEKDIKELNERFQEREGYAEKIEEEDDKG